MKDGQCFRGIFELSVDNPNYSKISEITERKWKSTYGFYTEYWYYMDHGILEYSRRKPNNFEEITYNQFEDWILNGVEINNEPNYEIY